MMNKLTHCSTSCISLNCIYITYFCTAFPPSGEISSVAVLTDLDTMSSNFAVKTEDKIEINTKSQYKFIKFVMRLISN